MAPRAGLTVEVADRHTPIVPSFTIAVVADGHKFLNDGRTFLYIKTNAVGENHLVTIQMPTSSDVDGLVVDDITFDLLDNSDYVMGPFPPKVYNQTDGMVYIDWEVLLIAGVSTAVVRIPV